MQTRIITTLDEFLNLRDAWAELHRASNGTLFQHPEWLFTWWELFGPSRQLAVGTYWSDGLLTGIAPVFTETRKLARLNFRRASFLGDAMVHGEYYPLVENSSVGEVARRAADQCLDDLRNGRVSILDFRSFAPDSSFMQAFLDRLRDGSTLRYRAEDYPHIVAEGAVNGEAFLKSRATRRRHELERMHRAMIRAGAEIRITAEWDGGKAFEDLVRLHTARWNHVGEPGRLSRYWFREFLRKASERLMATGNARIHSVYLRDEPVASMLAFKMHRRHYGYVIGRNPTHELMRYSVSDVLILRAMEKSFDEGCDCFDLMGGDYPYKRFFGTERKWYARATAIPPGIRGVRGRFFLLALSGRDQMNRFKRPWRSSRPVYLPGAQWRNGR